MTSPILKLSLSDYFDIDHDQDLTILKPLRKIKNICILDEGLFQTAICRSQISQIDSERLNLQYRGRAITDLAEHWGVLDVAYLLLTGKDDNSGQFSFRRSVSTAQAGLDDLSEQLAILAPRLLPTDYLSAAVLLSRDNFSRSACLVDDRLGVTAYMFAVMAVAIATYARNHVPDTFTQPFYGRDNTFLAAFMAAALGTQTDAGALALLNKFLILHAEHGLNCSTATVRAVASTGADPFSAVVAGIAAFKGPLHGGASENVGTMFDHIHENSLGIPQFIDDCLNAKQRLMGFGHRIYKKTDPRATYMKALLDVDKYNFSAIAPFVDICKAFNEEVTTRAYFVERGLFPNPDLFNGMLLRRAGFPSTMNTMFLCFSRMVGWLAHFYESLDDSAPLIRPRELHRA